VSVLVVGAGPVGLSLACELERHGVDFRIVDAAAVPTAVSRATDLHARSLELWDFTGIADAIVDAGLVITGVPLFSGGREVARLDFGGIDSAFPAAISLRQRDVEELLRDHLAARVEWMSPVEYAGQDEEGVDVQVAGKLVRARYLVACDGVHSCLRQALGIPFEGGDYPGRWAVMDARVDGWPYDEAELPVFLDADGFWAMPLPGGPLRLFFRDDDAGDLPDVADAQRVIDRHVPGGARIREAENLHCFQLHHRVAASFRSGRVFLAGDAAHAMTPVNGQGMNTGIQDAFNLAWKLRLALDGAAACVLDTYETERRPVAQATVTGSGEVHEANLLTGGAADERDHALAAAFATPAQVLAAVEEGHELHTAYPDSELVAGRFDPVSGGLLPGRRVPSTTSLRQLLRVPGLQLWLWDGEGAPELAERLSQRLHVRVFAEAEEKLLPRNAVYVIRPDGYVAFRCEPPDADWLDDRLGQLWNRQHRGRRPPTGPAPHA
jgi:2-polyprenyl-6-methoxyphenol hydroxylase-like FAD-dependent oxidoreductase